MKMSEYIKLNKIPKYNISKRELKALELIAHKQIKDWILKWYPVFYIYQMSIKLCLYRARKLKYVLLESLHFEMVLQTKFRSCFYRPK